MAYQSIMDARLPLVNIGFAKNTADARKSFRDVRLPKFLGFYERLMTARDPGVAKSGVFLCGRHPTYADVTLCEFIIYAREEISSDVNPDPEPADAEQYVCLSAYVWWRVFSSTKYSSLSPSLDTYWEQRSQFRLDVPRYPLTTAAVEALRVHPRLRDYLMSPRRYTIPDENYVSMVCKTLDIPHTSSSQ